MAGYPPEGQSRPDWSKAKWRRRNHPFYLHLYRPSMQHDETLEPFHAPQGWDQRCEACVQAEAYVEAMLGRKA